MGQPCPRREMSPIALSGADSLGGEDGAAPVVPPPRRTGAHQYASHDLYPEDNHIHSGTGGGGGGGGGGDWHRGGGSPPRDGGRSGRWTTRQQYQSRRASRDMANLLAFSNPYDTGAGISYSGESDATLAPSEDNGWISGEGRDNNDAPYREPRQQQQHQQTQRQQQQQHQQHQRRSADSDGTFEEGGAPSRRRSVSPDGMRRSGTSSAAAAHARMAAAPRSSSRGGGPSPSLQPPAERPSMRGGRGGGSTTPPSPPSLPPAPSRRHLMQEEEEERAFAQLDSSRSMLRRIDSTSAVFAEGGGGVRPTRLSRAATEMRSNLSSSNQQRSMSPTAEVESEGLSRRRGEHAAPWNPESNMALVRSSHHQQQNQSRSLTPPPEEEEEDEEKGDGREDQRRRQGHHHHRYHHQHHRGHPRGSDVEKPTVGRKKKSRAARIAELQEKNAQLLRDRKRMDAQILEMERKLLTETNQLHQSSSYSADSDNDTNSTTSSDRFSFPDINAPDRDGTLQVLTEAVFLQVQKRRNEKVRHRRTKLELEFLAAQLRRTRKEKRDYAAAVVKLERDVKACQTEVRFLRKELGRQRNMEGGGGDHDVAAGGGRKELGKEVDVGAVALPNSGDQTVETNVATAARKKKVDKELAARSAAKDYETVFQSFLGRMKGEMRTMKDRNEALERRALEMEARVEELEAEKRVFAVLGIGEEGGGEGVASTPPGGMVAAPTIAAAGRGNSEQYSRISRATSPTAPSAHTSTPVPAPAAAQHQRNSAELEELTSAVATAGAGNPGGNDDDNVRAIDTVEARLEILRRRNEDQLGRLRAELGEQHPPPPAAVSAQPRESGSGRGDGGVSGGGPTAAAAGIPVQQQAVPQNRQPPPPMTTHQQHPSSQSSPPQQQPAPAVPPPPQPQRRNLSAANSVRSMATSDSASDVAAGLGVMTPLSGGGLGGPPTPPPPEEVDRTPPPPARPQNTESFRGFYMEDYSFS